MKSRCARGLSLNRRSRGNRTVHGPSREKSSIACLCRSAGHFLRSGFGEGIAELRRFLAILAGMQPSFSATQTVWRRGRDSNSRYRSEWLKSRRLPKLQGINLLSGDRRPDAVTALGQTSAVSSRLKRRMAGDSTAETGLYDASQAARLLRT